MLKEMKCEKFKQSIKNKTIEFHEGLNVILGSEDAANSIGKSTLMLMIDFCFGGNSYAKQKDYFDYIGHHEVLFSFKFQNDTKYFSRPTDDCGHYYECDSSYKHLGDKKAIEELFDISAKTKACHEAYDKMNAQAKAFTSARRFGFINFSIKSDKQLAEAKSKIDEAKKELSDSISESQIGDIILDTSFTEEDMRLATQYQDLQKRIIKLRGEYSRLKKMTGESELIDGEDVAKLKMYFPSFEIKSIEEINKFQKELIKNVNFEVACRQKEIDAELLDLENKIAKIKKRLEEAKIPSKLTKSSVDNILVKKEKLDLLEKQVENYEKWRKLNQDKKDSLIALKELELSLMPTIEKSLNNELSDLNTAIYKEQRYAPRFTIKDPNHYLYFTPADSGTGTKFKSLILFDLALLKISNLPAVIHDSLLFKNIWNEPVSGIFKEYSTIKKQVFVAIDRIGDFDEESKEIINKGKTIELGENSESLFGFSWAKKNEKDETAK